MGTLRFILAVAVATAHSGCFWDYCVFPGAQAVQLFFIISGFLMALILSEKYDPKDKWLFYSNRALRIFVPYLFVLGVSFLAIFPFVHAFGYYPSYAAPLFQNAPAFDFWTWIFVLFSTLAIFGQDVGLWLGFDGHLFLSSQFLPGPVPVHTLQLLPQAWTLSLELMFYVIAPFLVRDDTFCLYSRSSSAVMSFKLSLTSSGLRASRGATDFLFLNSRVSCSVRSRIASTPSPGSGPSGKSGSAFRLPCWCFLACCFRSLPPSRAHCSYS